MKARSVPVEARGPYTMDIAQVNHYASQADAKERDPYGPDGSGRATVVNGRGFRWTRFHAASELVYVTTLDGRLVGMTPWQARVFDVARTYCDNGTVTIRALAKELGCAPSTVSRALVKLMSWGLLGYVSGRGRYAGSLIFRMHKGDGLDRFRQAAKAKVRQWSQAAQRRLSRLEFNVAPYFLERGRERNTLTDYLSNLTTVKGATLKEWTAEDVAGIV